VLSRPAGRSLDPYLGDSSRRLTGLISVSEEQPGRGAQVKGLEGVTGGPLDDPLLPHDRSLLSAVRGGFGGV